MFASGQEKGQMWNRGSTSVSPNHKDGVFRFIIVASNMDGVEGEDILGDIAVDDLALSAECRVDDATLPPTIPSTTSAEYCLEDEEFCRDEAGTCVSKELLCNFVSDCPNNFDEVYNS